jgi:hypothetical protein
MKRSLLKNSTVLIAGAMAAAGTMILSAQPRSPQDKPAQESTTASPSRLTGQWHFNKELSTPPQDESQQGGQSVPGRPGRGGGGFGGGRGGPGGGLGGRGGYSGGRTSAGNAEDLAKMRALRRELADPAEVLTIVVGSSEVTMTDGHGITRKFKTDGKKQEIELEPGVKIDATSKWDADVLTQELSAGALKLAESFQVTVQGHMMVITIASKAGGGGRSQATPIKYVYERTD